MDNGVGIGVVVEITEFSSRGSRYNGEVRFIFVIFNRYWNARVKLNLLYNIIVITFPFVYFYCLIRGGLGRWVDVINCLTTLKSILQFFLERMKQYYMGALK